MSKLLFPVLCLIAAYALFFGYLAFSYGQLPLKVASHFNFQGAPDGWMTRSTDAEIMSAVALIVPGLVIGTMANAGRIPISFINIPHRDYWLATGRRATAVALLRRFGLWFATLNVVFLTGLNALTVDANLHAPCHLNMQLLVTAAILYLVLTTAWLLRLLHHFSKV
jgi:uncharacterized membrane protein